MEGVLAGEKKEKLCIDIEYVATLENFRYFHPNISELSS
jgi:hypothetical protein